MFSKPDAQLKSGDSLHYILGWINYVLDLKASLFSQPSIYWNICSSKFLSSERVSWSELHTYVLLKMTVSSLQISRLFAVYLTLPQKVG